MNTVAADDPISSFCWVSEVDTKEGWYVSVGASVGASSIEVNIIADVGIEDSDCVETSSWEVRDV